MLNTLHPVFSMRLSQVFVKSTLLTTVVLASLLGGVVPQFTPTTPTLLSFESKAAAQSFTATEITNYAKAVLAIERLRQPAFSEIKRMLNSSSVPTMVCNQSDGASQLPNSARQIFMGYCQQSKTIVETNGLSASRFNEMTTLIRSNNDLQRKVRDELIRLQK